jgi:hypothetical protein
MLPLLRLAPLAAAAPAAAAAAARLLEPSVLLPDATPAAASADLLALVALAAMLSHGCLKGSRMLPGSSAVASEPVAAKYFAKLGSSARFCRAKKKTAISSIGKRLLKYLRQQADTQQRKLEVCTNMLDGKVQAQSVSARQHC